MDSSESDGVESPESDSTPDTAIHEVRYVIRLPCGHMIDEPKGTMVVVCNEPTVTKPDGLIAACGRKWHVWKKGIEQLAREEF